MHAVTDQAIADATASNHPAPAVEAGTKMATRGVSVRYGDNQALAGVNLEIGENRVTALIGPSGCGKSTFLRCLNRMNDTIPECVVTGEVTMDGESIYDRAVDVVLPRAPPSRKVNRLRA